MSQSPRAISIAVTIALHAAAVGALLQVDAVRTTLAQAVPLMVSLIAPPPPPPPPKIEPPKPRPLARAPQPQLRVPQPEPPPLLAAETGAPGPVWTVPPPKADPPPIAVAPPPARAPAPPIVPPAFDAAYLQNPPPAYPAMSRRRGEQGLVVLRVFVNAEGEAERVEVRTSSGHERLDRAAHDAVHRWRFVPARRGERPVAAWVLVPITFSLEG
jgi:protein TonB